MNKNNYVKITKLKPCDNPLYPPANKNEYNYGMLNENVSVPIDYTVEGYLLEDIKLNKPISMHRKIRNGIKIEGFFVTSAVKSIDLKNHKFETANSVYLVEPAIVN